MDALAWAEKQTCDKFYTVAQAGQPKDTPLLVGAGSAFCCWLDVGLLLWRPDKVAVGSASYEEIIWGHSGSLGCY